MTAAVSHVVQAEGAVGVLVNNAGYSQSGAVETVPLDEVRRQFETNVFGAIRMCQLVLPGMRDQRWGKIVTIARWAAGSPFRARATITQRNTPWSPISDALRFEVRGFGIDVILIEPGLIVTRFGDVAAGSVDVAGPALGPTSTSTARWPRLPPTPTPARWPSSAAVPMWWPPPSRRRWRPNAPRRATSSPRAPTS